MTSTYQARQGDVFIRAIDGVPPKSAKPIPTDAEYGGVVLAYGEVTGHAHAIREGRARLYRDDAIGRTFLQVDAGGAVLSHEEHSSVTLEPGLYDVTIQREYAYGEQRRVED